MKEYLAIYGGSVFKGNSQSGWVKDFSRKPYEYKFFTDDDESAKKVAENQRKVLGISSFPSLSKVTLESITELREVPLN